MLQISIAVLQQKRTRVMNLKRKEFAYLKKILEKSEKMKVFIRLVLIV